jgi:hypothetical protein
MGPGSRSRSLSSGAHSRDPLARLSGTTAEYSIFKEQPPAFPRHDSAGACRNVRALRKERRRESRAPTAPAAPCAKNCETTHTVFDRYSRDIPAFPAQWFYGLYVLSPGRRPFLPPLPAENFRQRSARVAAPGPHDFAVRGVPSSGERTSTPFGIKPLRLRLPRPSHPLPNVS